MIAAAALQLLEALAAVLPARWLYAGARLAGTLMLPVLERRRQRARAAVQRFHPAWSPERLNAAVKRQFQETAMYYVDLVLLSRASPEQILHDWLTIEGLDQLQAALRSRRGVVMVSVHLSNPEVAIQALRPLGATATVIVEALDERRLESLRAQRESGGNRFVPATLSGVREALQTLEEGGVVAILTDRDIQGNGICVPFAGRLARFPVGAVDLALRADAILLPAFATRLRDHRFRVDFMEPQSLLHSEEGDRAKDVRATLALLMCRFEEPIQTHVEQWRVVESPWRGCRD
jgi:lauroyl/myristoyl acyltransferase